MDASSRRMAHRSDTRTLGQLLRQARQQHGLSLRQAALQIHRKDGTPISPQYLHDLEHDRRRPSFGILQELIRVLGLDDLEVLAHVGNAEAIIRAYLRERPNCEPAIIHLFLTAQQQGFAAWERLTRQIASLPRPGPR
jgi:transcriptional regulator with XRE-family HTH domain